MKHHNPGIVICVEKGFLEYKALCLVLTLRANWGSWSDVPIYSYSPRQGREISPWLCQIFRDKNVEVIVESLNQEYFDYPLANKPLAMAHAEKHTGHDLLVFLDSDILCWNEPTEFDLPAHKSLGLVADTTKTVASAGPGDPNEESWQDLYRLLGVEYEPFVETTLTQERVRGWWGTGVMSVRSEERLMAEWLDFFKLALNRVSFRPQAHYLREQMTLCVIAARHFPAVHDMPVTYNFPVQNHGVFAARGINASDAVLWHYQPYLNRAFRKFAQDIDAKIKISEKEGVALKFIEDVRCNYPKRLGRDEGIFLKWRRHLHIGTRVRSLFNRS